MRLFIAIDLKELKDYFKEIQDQIPRDIAKLKPVNTFHLTLKFLGEVPDEKTEEIKEALAKIKFSQFKLTLDQLGVFPTENYIRVVWIGLKGNSHLSKLQEDIEKVLDQFYFKKDYEFLPHLTLARVKFISNKPEFIQKLKQIKIERKEITINKFKLIKSELTRQGPIYEDLAIFP